MPNKNYFILLLGVVLALSIGVMAVKAIDSDKAKEKEKGVISVTGNAEKQVTSDTVKIRIAVETENKQIPKAIKLNNEKMNNIISSLKEILQEENSNSLETTGFSVYPIYEYKDKTRIKKGYKIRNELTVKTKKIELTNKILEISLDNGANNIQNIEFLIENKQKYCQELFKQAVSEGKSQAKAVAKELNTELIGIKRVNTFCDSNTRPIFYRDRAALSKMETGSSSSIPIEPGSSLVKARVNIEFFVK